MKSVLTFERRKIVVHIRKHYNITAQHLIINADCGIGKSYTAIDEQINLDIRSLVCVPTNAKVDEMVVWLNDKGVTAQGLTSTKHNLAKYKVYPPAQKQQHPYDLERIGNDASVIKTIRNTRLCDEDAAIELLNKCKTPDLDFENHQFVVITQHRLQILRRQGELSFNGSNIIPPDVTIIIDDPSYAVIKNFKIITDDNREFIGKKVYGSELKTRTSKDRRYEFFIKPESMQLSYKLTNKFIWLTADVTKVRLIESLYPKRKRKTVAISPSFGDKGGSVNFIGSDITRVKYHHLLLPIVARVDRMMHDSPTTLMSVGLAQEDNVITIEGSNEYMNMHSVQKLSQPNSKHLYEIREQTKIDLQELTVLLMVDELHQMTGRSRGARKIINKSKRNYDFTIIVDTQYFSRIIKRCNHIIDRSINFTKTQPKIERPKKNNRFDLYCWLISNRDDYITGVIDGRRASKLIIKDLTSAMHSVRYEKTYFIAQKYVNKLAPIRDALHREWLMDNNEQSRIRCEELTVILLWLQANHRDMKEDLMEVA